MKIDQHQVFDQISGSKIRNGKTESENVLNLTLMVNDLYPEASDMIFNTSVLKVILKN